MGEKLVAAGSILAAAGFLSLRSHFNYLGISVGTSIGLERYLIEAGVFLSTLIDQVFVPAGIVILGFHIVIVFVPQRVKEWKWARFSAFPLVLQAAAITLYVGVFWLGSTLSMSDIGLGKLKVTEAPLRNWFDVLVLFCIGGLWLSQQALAALKSSADTVAVPLWKFFSLSTFIIALQIPVLFGRMVRPSVYPIARVETSAKAVCGLIVFEDESVISLWHVLQGGVGEVMVIPRTQVTYMTVGELQNLEQKVNEVAKYRQTLSREKELNFDEANVKIMKELKPFPDCPPSQPLPPNHQNQEQQP